MSFVYFCFNGWIVAYPAEEALAIPMPTKVFIAYADTYIGGQLLRQFEHKPEIFLVYGCVWEKENAEKLAAQHAQEAVKLTSAPLRSSQRTSANESDLRSVDNLAAVEKEKLFSQALTTEAMPTSTIAFPSSQFFWRRDGVEVRKALSVCEWIVIEQREAQDVFEILYALQQLPKQPRPHEPPLHPDKSMLGASFDKPKRLVLLSNFMSWFATPSLSQTHDERTQNEGEEQSDEFDKELDRDEEETEIDAPYPPPPMEREEGDEFAASEDKNEVAGNDEDEDSGENAAISSKEILTEDQFNRRVPHIKYFNWRDAEKAVASAHRAHGLPLDSFVVFAGMPYGEGEDFLEPYFRQAWSATMEGSNNSTTCILPIFGSGEQRVPMIHVRDLVTFTRKLLRCPLQELPQQRYIFATDSDTPHSWRTIVKTINYAFGGVCSMQTVEPRDFVLYDRVEHFTVDLRVERGAIKAIMEREDEVSPDEGKVWHFFGNEMQNQLIAANPIATTTGSWFSDGGFKRNMEKISWEFRLARHVTPLRVAVLGPPLAGKRYLAAKLAQHYKLPVFQIEDVVEAFREHLHECKKRVETYRAELIRGERTRRSAIKEDRVRRAVQRGKRKGAAAERQVILNAQETQPDAGDVQVDEPILSVKHDIEVDDDDDGTDFAAQCRLTPEEEKEADQLMEERVAASPKVEQWRRKIAEMERILLMRVRPSVLNGADDVVVSANSKRGISKPSGFRKKLTKEQQRKKEEEELQLAKEALQGAPFQDEALALMLRWRLSKPSCLNQGYILIGFPRTAHQARLCFGCEPLVAPATEEEALHPRSHTAALPGRGENVEEIDDGVAKQQPRNIEPSEEARLPDHVLVLRAEDDYILKRWNALSNLQSISTYTEIMALTPSDTEASAKVISNDGAAAATGIQLARELSPGATTAKETVLENFNEDLATFKQQFGSVQSIRGDSNSLNDSATMVAPASNEPCEMLSYWESAVTLPGSVTQGGRRARLHQINIQKEPLVPPTLGSQYEAPPLSALEVVAQEKIGVPHYFGKTPLEVHQEMMRRTQLEEERLRVKHQAEQDARCRAENAYSEELAKREQVDVDLQAILAADRAALEERKAPLQKYLMKQVMPLLSKGLVEVSAQRPENPVDYLAEWLLRHNPHDGVFSDL